MVDNGFSNGLNVSRETLEKLEIYLATLKKWNPRINLVSKTTISEAWNRHFVDSLQIFDLASTTFGWESWCDFGSGGGFPGLVVAIAASDRKQHTQVTLIESDQRKCTFLREVARACDVAVTIKNVRIEEVPALGSCVVSGRALASLTKLLEFSEKHRDPDGICLFHKGQSVHKELEEALQNWKLDYKLHPSLTDDGASIVEIGAFQRGK
ncbi:16S rRNA (guanine(527)-N(7))-methyltransferase RsmG [Amaricoccus tamworthensis]|uniref:16S rRNA (guanine(527)-N(7))-methyltransferase RsmG n=1 Tax=Amaricoccus tamworthensis TaxID=57002 RepID=UPI003C7ADEB9